MTLDTVTCSVSHHWYASQVTASAQSTWFSHFVTLSLLRLTMYSCSIPPASVAGPAGSSLLDLGRKEFPFFFFSTWIFRHCGSSFLFSVMSSLTPHPREGRGRGRGSGSSFILTVNFCVS